MPLIIKCLKYALTLSFLLLLIACDKAFPPSPYTCDTQPEQYKNIEERNASLFVLWAAENTNLLIYQNEIIATVQDSYKQPFKLWFRDNSINNFTFSDKEHELADGNSAVISAVVSVNDTNPNTLIHLQKLLSRYGISVAIYSVQQSIPLAYEKNWQSGEQTPALISMSFFQKPEHLSKEAFKNYWFCAHTPFAIDIHPLWHYERNAVEQQLTEGSPNYDGIVPLYIKNDHDISFPNFFGADGNNPLFNALRIQSDVSRFINLELIETVPMREFVVEGSGIQ